MMGEGKMPLFKAVVINQKIQLTKKKKNVGMCDSLCSIAEEKEAHHDLKTIPC